MNAPHHRELEIVQVLARHGFGYLLDRAGVVHANGSGQSNVQHTRPEHLRLALEELGPTFIKLGQALSMRTDLLPADYRQELVKLQDDAPHLAPQVVWEILSHELGAKAEEAFGSFQLEPLAAASIGQAHGATLRDGTEVVVKVRRPGAVDQIEQDIAILKHLAASPPALAARRSDRPGRLDRRIHTNAPCRARLHPRGAQCGTFRRCLRR